MSDRPKCARDGHKFRDTSAMRLPYVFCARWQCSASAVAAWAPAEIAADLHNAIPLADRFPPGDAPAADPSARVEGGA